MSADIIDLLAIAFFPAIALTFLYFWKHWRWLNASSALIQILLGIVGPILIFGTWFGIIINQSAIALIVTDLTFIIFGFGFLALTVLAARAKHVENPGKKWLAVIFGGCMGFGFVSYWGWQLIGDFILPRREDLGVVNELKIIPGRSLFYRVFIDGKHYHTTANIYETMQPNTRVRAEVGAGSGNIFKVDLVPETRG